MLEFWAIYPALLDEMPGRLRVAVADAFLRLIEEVGWPKRERRHMMQALHRSTWIGTVWKDRRIVGVARIVGDGRFALTVVDVLVDPEHQNEGVGTLLLAHAQVIAQIMGAERIDLIASPESTGFYDQIGWTRIQGFTRFLQEPTP